MRRVLLAKTGLDGHDRGALALTYALRDRGIEVIYSGIRSTPQEIAVTALQEDVDTIGISSLSGSHLADVRNVMAELRDAGIDDKQVLVGGIIPPNDVSTLQEMGVDGVFGPESTVDDIVAVIEGEEPAEGSDVSHGITEIDPSENASKIVSGGPDTSMFGTPIADEYTEDDLADFSPEDQLGESGDPPFARGIREGMYRDDLWVMGMYSGYGTPEETNERLHELIDSGETGFSLALDLPTQLGMDSDDPLAAGSVGRTGTPICSQYDVETIFEDIPLDEMKQIRTSANSVGPIMAAFIIGAAEEHGHDPSDFKLLLQNDSLKEFVTRGTQIFPPEYARKLSVDVMEYFADEIPHWEPIEFCAYHFRDSGADPSWAVAYAIGDAFEYLDAADERGLDVEEVVRNAYIFMTSVGNRGLLEEVAKFRASRRAWRKILQDRYDVTDEEALKLNIFCWGGMGSGLTSTEPKNNIIRTAYGSLAAVLGGVQTLAVHGYDEALGLPTEDAARVALRIQQILAHETGVTKTADPLGGSYFIENLTNDFEEQLFENLEEIESEGGMLEKIENGSLKREIARAGYEDLRKIETGEQPVVGVNLYSRERGGSEIKPFEIDESVEDHQVERLETVREERDDERVEAALANLQEAAEAGENTIPALLEASRAYATIGEITDSLKTVYGTHTPQGL